MSAYTFQRNTPDERARLAGLEQVWDTTTIGLLDSLGVSHGWRCLEVGAGAGTIARWMARRVGATGEVTATDLDPSMFGLSAVPSLRVIKHDITTDPLPERGFDLVHARFLLSHLPGRREIVGVLKRACHPGGFLVVEDFDINCNFSELVTKMESSMVQLAHANELFGKVFRAIVAIMISFGFEPSYGRHVAADMQSNGFIDVSSMTTARLVRGATPAADFNRYTVLRFAERLVETGDVSDDEIDRLMDLFDNPCFEKITAPLVSTWGRAPA